MPQRVERTDRNRGSAIATLRTVVHAARKQGWNLLDTLARPDPGPLIPRLRHGTCGFRPMANTDSEACRTPIPTDAEQLHRETRAAVTPAGA